MAGRCVDGLGKRQQEGCGRRRAGSRRRMGGSKRWEARGCGMSNCQQEVFRRIKGSKRGVGGREGCYRQRACGGREAARGRKGGQSASFLCLSRVIKR